MINFFTFFFSSSEIHSLLVMMLWAALLSKITNKAMRACASRTPKPLLYVQSEGLLARLYPSTPCRLPASKRIRVVYSRQHSGKILVDTVDAGQYRPHAHIFYLYFSFYRSVSVVRDGSRYTQTHPQGRVYLKCHGISKFSSISSRVLRSEK